MQFQLEVVTYGSVLMGLEFRMIKNMGNWSAACLDTNLVFWIRQETDRCNYMGSLLLIKYLVSSQTLICKCGF